MSEHMIAQPQRANEPQTAAKDAVSLRGRDISRTESTTLQEWWSDTASGTFAGSRFAYDFSRVSAFTGIEQQAQPLLRTQPLVQQFPRDEAAGSAPCPNCPEAASSDVSAPVEPEAETAEPMIETPDTETETTPAPVELGTESAAPGETPASALIVEDSAAELAPGQMKKSEFLSQLRSEVCRTVEAAIAGTGRTTEDCPYLNHWFDFYERQDSAHIERSIHRYAPEAAGVTTASGYISVITQRARQSAETWARTGEITGVPEGLPMGLPGMDLLGGIGRLFSGIGNIFFKARKGGARKPDDPQAIQSELGEGQPLDSGVRSRMESAFGMDFTHVRTHTDSAAAGLSDRMNARAFTVGEHVAFGANEYKPGTLVGDALIAHELAHVVQQNGANSSVAPMETGGAGYNTLEKDADRSAFGAIASLWGGAKGALAEIGKNTMPGLRSGLRLQRCAARGTTTTTPPTTTTTPPTSSSAPSSSSGTPCPTSVRLGELVHKNHSELPATQREKYRTYLFATSRMDVGPGPDHSGHCMKERLTTITNTCPADVYQREGEEAQPCIGDRCLGINQYSPRGHTFQGLSDSPTSFIDQHKTKLSESVLEGTGVDSCTVVCEQTYTCDRIHPTTGTFRITRNFQAGTYRRSDGNSVHITTGTVDKTEV